MKTLLTSHHKTDEFNEDVHYLEEEQHYGKGDGHGYGDDTGYAYGYGDGFGSLYGFGYGYGDGCGYGDSEGNGCYFGV
jgi:hypothetical protein